ncbi:MAG TPA: hypothetical protein VGG74_11825 [Kofleriaceae bacterium]
MNGAFDTTSFDAGAFDTTTDATPTFSIVMRPAPSSGPNNILLGAGTSASSSTTTDPNGTPLPAPTPNSPAPSDVTVNPGATIDALNAGSGAFKYVVAIEGYPYLLTDADPAKATLAWSSTDWTQALDGLFVNMDRQQQLDPWAPFQRGGSCILSVLPDATDRFGIDVARSSDGAQCGLIVPCNRYGTAQERFTRLQNGNIGEEQVYVDEIIVDNATGFVAGDVFIGTECISTSNPSTNSITGGASMFTYARGKYSPFASGGAGGANFAQHHRVTTDPQGVLLNPTVSQQPRVWIGRWIGVWMHTVDGNGTLNAKEDAQLVFAGQIAAINDDADTGCTTVEIAHVLDWMQDVTLGRDMFSAQLVQGWYLATGQTFSFYEAASGQSNSGAGFSQSANANPLVVVATGASGEGQVNAGYYTLEELCSILNAWLAGERASSRIVGTYCWASPVSGNGAIRTNCYWSYPISPTPGPAAANWSMSMDVNLYTYMGFDNAWGQNMVLNASGAQQNVGQTGQVNTNNLYQSTYTPWRIVAFTLNENNNTADIQLNVTNPVGTMIDQWALLPSTNRPPQQGLTWGCFIVNEQWLMVASFNQEGTVTTLSNCLVQQNLTFPGVQPAPALLGSFGTHAGDQNDTTPIPVRQVYLLEASFNVLLKNLFYGSGSAGYNSPTFDTLGYGLGMGIPGELLGAPFETSVDNQPGWLSPIVVVIDEPTKVSDLLSSDLVLRHAFPMWRSDGGAGGRGGLTLGRWSTPLTSTAVAALTEDNKAEPVGNATNQRMATTLDATWVKPIVKVDYNRDLTTSSTGGTYESSMTFEDETAVDDAGGAVDIFTVQARNTYAQYLGTGAGIESISPYFLDMLPMFTRPVVKGTRSIDQTCWESVHVGDVVLVDDTFARDPFTGTRGISAREALVARTRFNPGGFAPGSDGPPTTTGQVGEVDIIMLSNHLAGLYAPCALVNPIAGVNGFDSVLRSLHVLSSSFSLPTEKPDWENFKVGDQIRVTERDPVDPNNPQTWQAKILGIQGEVVGFPSFFGGALTLDKSIGPLQGGVFYQVTYDRYNQVAPLQQLETYLASLATGRIENLGYPYMLSSTNEPVAYVMNNDVAELLPATSYVDGAPMDVGAELALARTLNVLIDSKTARQSLSFEPGGPLSFASGSATWSPVVMRPIWLGLDASNGSISRYLTVAPSYFTDATLAGLRATLCQNEPTLSPIGVDGSDKPIFELQFYGNYDQVEWDNLPSSGTLQAVAPPLQLFINKNTSGWAWLVLEVSGSGAASFGSLGFMQVREGARVTKVLR